ncbi:fasciclin domain-containing protein [Chitinophaga arvensicola]|uniref:Fasciclin domain-containing protein n=1 Tax=Chitinophaga arvensicola TaxID=29529 RepID=A0A1I0R7D7_9BACT|nr:fasciclin domain-containing protein [Chitinophaga arvensicola]SEW36365.1 Fasciclin domain-containing protein [Chitinophaga arvensicola]
MRKLLPIAGILLMVGLLFSACKKDYYVDGGLADPHYKGTIYDYLVKNPYLFDTIAYIVEKAGLKETLQNDSVTFFAPTDQSVVDALADLNEYRYQMVEDSVKLGDIPPAVWRKFLDRYILKGKYTANKFARMDPVNIYAYPGINYVMAGGYILNIGLVYQNYNNVEAVGARILTLTDITFDPVTFNNNLRVIVSSSDIQPTNGVLHVLSMRHTFGFRPIEFLLAAEQALQNK